MQVLKILKHIALIVFIVAVPVALLIGVRSMPAVHEIPPPTAVELIGILFAGVTIILGVLAIIIAVLAIWGYAAIKIEAQAAATSTAKKAAVDHIESEALQNRLRDESRKIIEEELKKMQEGLAFAESQPAQGIPSVESPQESQKVGKSYSKE